MLLNIIWDFFRAMSRQCWSGAEGAFDHVLRVKTRLCKAQVPSLICSFIAHFRSAHSTLGAVVANYRVNKTDKIPALRKLPISWGTHKQKVNNKWTKELWVVISVMKKTKPAHVIDSG